MEMTNAQAKRELIKLVAAMLRSQIFNPYQPDWPNLGWTAVKARADLAEEKGEQWADRLLEIADSLDVKEHPGFVFNMSGGNK